MKEESAAKPTENPPPSREPRLKKATKPETWPGAKYMVEVAEVEGGGQRIRVVSRDRTKAIDTAFIAFAACGVHREGGKIVVQSATPRGTVFAVTLELPPDADALDVLAVAEQLILS